MTKLAAAINNLALSINSLASAIRESNKSHLKIKSNTSNNPYTINVTEVKTFDQPGHSHNK
jgi:hypothetical protein